MRCKMPALRKGALFSRFPLIVSPKRQEKSNDDFFAEMKKVGGLFGMDAHEKGPFENLTYDGQELVLGVLATLNKVHVVR